MMIRLILQSQAGPPTDPLLWGPIAVGLADGPTGAAPCLTDSLSCRQH